MFKRNIWTVSCKKASELIDKKFVVKLSLRENMMLDIHTSVCEICKQYEKQSRIIDEILKRHLDKNNPEEVQQVVNNELKQKIFFLLNKH
jgi:hypothetical protein